MTERDWQRVASAVRARREALGLRREDMHASASTVYKLESAAQDSYKSFALRKVEVDLGWPTGTIDTIADGGPLPSHDGDEVAALRNEVAELRRLLEDALGKLPDA